MRSSGRRSWVWCAWLAVVLNAIAPTLAQSAAWLQGRPLGIAPQAPLGFSAADPHAAHHIHGASHERGGEPHAMHDGHCPFCFTHAGSFALPPVAMRAALPSPAQSKARPTAWATDVARADALLAAQPRGPPAAG